jgi:hypothetical protein
MKHQATTHRPTREENENVILMLCDSSDIRLHRQEAGSPADGFNQNQGCYYGAGVCPAVRDADGRQRGSGGYR